MIRPEKEKSGTLPLTFKSHHYPEVRKLLLLLRNQKMLGTYF